MKEYADCGSPNENRVYISYLDSVKYFRPGKLRTLLYYELINGYMQYCGTLGFVFFNLIKVVTRLFKSFKKFKNSINYNGSIKLII